MRARHPRSSLIYRTFDLVLVLAHGRTLYSGAGSFAPVTALAATGAAPAYTQGYNVADYLIEVASDPPVALLARGGASAEGGSDGMRSREGEALIGKEAEQRGNAAAGAGGKGDKAGRRARR